MDGYRLGKIVQTPWGNAAELRGKMLRPGPGIPREEVARSQRERLFAATVACLARSGYEQTTVADLLELSGVSRSAFYSHFRDKQECVLTTYEAIVAMAREQAERDFRENGSEAEVGRSALRTLLEAVAAQPATARLCFFDVYASGLYGRLTAGQATKDFVPLAEQAIAGAGNGARLPEPMVHGVLGGSRSVIQLHLRRREEAALPGLADELWKWASGYEPPSVRLRSGRRPRPPAVDQTPIGAYSQAERIVRAMAAIVGERGYPAVAVAEVAARASVSQATFYANFSDKEAALAAALDSADSQMLAVALPAARRAADWPDAVRAAIGGLCAFYASEPDLARLALVELPSVGAELLDRHDSRMAELRSLLGPGLDAVSGSRPVLEIAPMGAMWALLHLQLEAEGPQSLPRIAPLASYMVLAPLVGNETAAEVVGGNGRGPER